jgi:hypothetical protein
VRQAFTLVVILVCCFVLSCHLYSLSPMKAPPIPENEQCTPEEMKSSKNVSANIYGEIQIERQTEMRDHLKTKLAIYRKYGGPTTEAEEEIAVVDTQHEARLQEILTRHGLQTTDELKPSEPCRQQAMHDRQAYMDEHPQLRKKFMVLSSEMFDLQEKIDAFRKPE